MTKSSQFLRQYTRMFLEDAERTRVMFPDLKEMQLQATDTWKDTKINLDFLTKPNGLLDIGIDLSGHNPTAGMQPDETVFIAAYPSFDPRELVAADKVWKRVEMDEDKRKSMIIWNAELCRLRSDYFPNLFYPEMARLKKELIPMVETVYYIHNFKGAGGGALFRCYPGPWQVLLRVVRPDGELDTVEVHTSATRPTLKEVSLEILPRAALEYRKG